MIIPIQMNIIDLTFWLKAQAELNDSCDSVVSRSASQSQLKAWIKESISWWESILSM